MGLETGTDGSGVAAGTRVVHIYTRVSYSNGEILGLLLPYSRDSMRFRLFTHFRGEK